MKHRTLALILLSLFTLSLLAGCNTMRGAGQDIERGGEAIQRSAD
jgi:entericidin B